MAMQLTAKRSEFGACLTPAPIPAIGIGRRSQAITVDFQLFDNSSSLSQLLSGKDPLGGRKVAPTIAIDNGSRLQDADDDHRQDERSGLNPKITRVVLFSLAARG
jgi:hypothetical protein